MIPQKLIIQTDIKIAELDMSKPARNLLIANITENINTTVGYKVIITSDNDGRIIGSSPTSKPVSYNIKYGSKEVSKLSSLSDVILTKSSSAMGVFVKPLTISYDVPRGILKDANYKDSLIISIISN